MPGKHALVIGNSQYEDPTLAKLKAPEADVRVLAELLRDSAIGQFESVRTVIDESEAATRRAIAGFFTQGRPDELLLLYFSGHGVLDDKGRLYLAAKDTQRDLPQATAIPAAFITDGMDSSRSRRQVLILDCCHSGAFARGARSATGAKAITETTFEGVGYGRAVLTATDATQYAWEGEAVIGAAENSVFTHHMIEGLRSGAADNDGDGDITLEELYDYIYENVVKQTPKQTPRKWSYNQEGALIIARNPNPPAPKPTALPPELQQTIDDPRPWVREGGVAELSRLLTGSHPGLAAAAYDALQRLTTDDSRRVAEAASRALAAHRPTLEPTAAEQQAERERLSREAARKLAEQQKAQEEAARLAAERQAEKAKQSLPKAEDRRAVERAEGEGMVVHPPTPTTPATPIASERQTPVEKEDRRAIERAEGEGMAASIPTPVAGPKLPASVTAWMAKPWFPLAVLSLGWGAALFSSIFIYWILERNGQDISGLAYSLVLGLLSGAATWYALRVATPNERDIPPVLIIGLWVAAALFGSLLYSLLESNIGIDESAAATVAVFGALGGAGTSVVLYWRRIVNRQRAIIIAGGWAVAWLVSAWLGLSFINLFGSDVPQGLYESLRNLGLIHDVAVMLIPWVISLIQGLMGALAGAIGGWVMLRELKRDNGGISHPPAPRKAVEQNGEAADRKRTHTILEEASPVRAIAGLPAWVHKPWFPLAMFTVGWGLAFFTGTFIFWFLYQSGQEIGANRFGELLVLGLIGGAATWLALRAMTPKGNELPPLLIIGGWVALALVGVWLNPYLQENGMGVDESVAWERAIFGVLGGAALGVVLYRRRIINSQRAVFIAAGWAIGWSLAVWLGLSAYNLFGDDPRYGIKMAFVGLGLDHKFSETLVPWVDSLIRGLTGALAGFISGWVTVGQLREPQS